MNPFHIFQPHMPPIGDLTQILDRMYRITDTELQQILVSQFDVTIQCADHLFLEDPGKPGWDTTVTLIQPPDDARLPNIRAYKHGPLTVFRNNTAWLVVYETRAMRLRVCLSGYPRSLRRWHNAFVANSSFYTMMFLYAFHRLRGASDLEQTYTAERKLFETLNRTFRSNSQSTSGPVNSLTMLAQFMGAHTAVVSLCNATTNLVVPVAASDPRFFNKATSSLFTDLPLWDHLVSSRDNAISIRLSASTSYKCNCEHFKIGGDEQAIFVPFGHEPSQTLPRGILSLYRRTYKPLDEKDKLNLRLAGREIAAWINELDEAIENDVIQHAIATAAKHCGELTRRVLDASVITTILADVGNIVSSALGRFDLFREQPEMLRLGFIVDQRQFGSLIDTGDTSRLQQLTSSIKPSIYPHGTKHSLLCWPENESKRSFLLAAGSQPRLSLLRAVIFDSLVSLMQLVYRLILVEQRRMSWMQLTIHEIRHPLQALTASHEELLRLASDPTATKKTMAHWIEDMDTAAYRLDVMLKFINHIDNPDRISVKRKSMLIEADVLRPIRRVLTGVAKMRGITIGEPSRYFDIPPLNSDPELLSLVVYNLLSNAIKYSRDGTPIHVDCKRLDSGCWIDISNMGFEIGEDETERIFEYGIRGRAAERRELGFGIGLAFARRILRELDCTIHLMSRGANGTLVIFRIIIPEKILL